MSATTTAETGPGRSGHTIGETAAASIAGALLGGAAGSLVGQRTVGALVGGLNGVVCGSRRIYDWSSAKGVAAFALDSTWSLLNTAGSLVCHGVAALQRDAGFDTQLSKRANRHVYRRGLQLRKGFAMTVGNVVNGAGDLSRAGRRRLVIEHEDVHVWQARGFGPLFPVLYGGWTVAGATIGATRWIAGRHDAALARTVDTYAYYLNPFEWWAYSRHATWPPSGKLDGVGWQRPIVASFAARREGGQVS